MTCDDRALVDLFFGELPLDRAASLQRHAAGCAGCTRALDALRADRALFRARRVGPPSLDRMFGEVERRIRAPRRSWRPQAWARGLVPLSGACLAVLLALTAPSVAETFAPDGTPSVVELENALSMCVASPDGVTPDVSIPVAPVSSLRSSESSAALACF